MSYDEIFEQLKQSGKKQLIFRITKPNKGKNCVRPLSQTDGVKLPTGVYESVHYQKNRTISYYINVSVKNPVTNKTLYNKSIQYAKISVIDSKNNYIMEDRHIQHAIDEMLSNRNKYLSPKVVGNREEKDKIHKKHWPGVELPIGCSLIFGMYRGKQHLYLELLLSGKWEKANPSKRTRRIVGVFKNNEANLTNIERIVTKPAAIVIIMGLIEKRKKHYPDLGKEYFCFNVDGLTYNLE